MKVITSLAAVCTFALFAADCGAQPPGRKAGDKRPAANGQREMDGRRAAAARRDPGQIANRMMQQFDKDGDQKLNVQELSAMLIALRERSGNGGPGGIAGQRKRPGQADQTPGGKRKRSNENDSARPGGEKPTRPEDQ